MLRVAVIAFWTLGATTDLTLAFAHPAEPARAAAATINFDDLHGQATAAIERLQLAQAQRLALRTDVGSF
ncbi:MAG TPA: hypothetical protein VFB45_18445 [Pseudolabrys sp.]|nr:hypothetical protein [Pseudolabrys sp.]